MTKLKEINLSQLLVNPENYRFEPVENQKEAISIMIFKQKEKLYNLAAHILQYGLNPFDKILVSPTADNADRYTVLEGNRRTVVLKLLINPDLIDESDFPTLRKKFKALSEANKGKLINKVECQVYEDSTQADIWIKIKHDPGASGIGTEEWDSIQKRRFEEKVDGTSSVVLQVIDLLKKSEHTPTDIKENVGGVKPTNLIRLLNDPDVRDALGITVNDGNLESEIEEKEVVRGLSKVVSDLLKPDFKVAEIYRKEDRKRYISSLNSDYLPNKSTKSSKTWTLGATQNSPAKTTPRPRRQPIIRKKLIPSSCTISIGNPKINRIYQELQKIDLIKFPNSTAVLFRVFVELSVDSYLEDNGLVSSVSAAKSGENLMQKVLKVAQHLDQKKQADKTICKGIRSAVKNSDDLLGIDTWHAYVHNNRFSPTSDNLAISWDNIQDFMVILWKNIK